MDFYIRPMNNEDSKAINELKRQPDIVENIMAMPSESIDQSKKEIASTDVNRHQFVAISNEENKIIGAAELYVNTNQRMRHSGLISMVVHKDYRDKGIGTILLKKLMDIADNWLMLVRVELIVFEGNKSAIHLYEKLGFEKEGLKKYAAIRKGQYEHAYLMARINTRFINNQLS